MEILFCILGIVIGVGVSYVYIRSRSVGCIRVDRSDPDEPPYLFLELSGPVETVTKHGYVILNVQAKDFVPHK